MQTTPIRRFAGGLQLKLSDVDIDTRQLQYALNCRMVGESIETAPGFVKQISEGGIATNGRLNGAVTWLWGGQINTTFVQLAADESGGFWTLVGNTATTITAGFSTTYLPDADRYGGRLFIVNGVDANQKHDGTTLSNQGIVGPVAAPNPATWTTIAGAMAAGTYQFYYTYWDNTHAVESNPHPLPASYVLGAPGGINIPKNTLALSPDANVTHFRVYLTETNGTDAFRKRDVVTASFDVPHDLVGNIQFNTDTVEGPALEFDNDPPTPWLCVRYHRDALVGILASDRSQLVWSKAFRPEQIPLTNVAILGEGVDEEGVCLERFFNYLVIGTQQGIYVVDGDLNAGATPRRVTNYVGMLNHRAHAIKEQTFYFVGTDLRIYALNATDFASTDVRPRYVAEAIEPLLQYVEPAIARRWACCVMHHHQNRYELYVSLPIGITQYNTTVPVLDASPGTRSLESQDGAWTLDTKRVSAWGVMTMSDGSSQLWHGDERGWIWRNDLTSGYGAEINGTCTGPNGGGWIDDTTAIDGTGTVTASGLSTITDGTATWTANQFMNLRGVFTSGAPAVDGFAFQIVSNTATTITIAGLLPAGVAPGDTFEIGGFLGPYENWLMGVQIAIVGGTGAGQVAIVGGSEQPGRLFIEPPGWSIIPDATSQYSVGPIDFHVWTGWDAHTEAQEHTKRGQLIHLSTVQEGNYTLDYRYRFDMLTPETVYAVSLSAGGALWAGAFWLQAYWGSNSSFTTDLFFDADMDLYRRMQHRFRLWAAGMPVRVNYVAVSYQDKGIML